MGIKERCRIKHKRKEHFKQRMKERYGMIVNSKDIACIRDMIRIGKCFDKTWVSRNRLKCRIKFQGIIIYLIFDVKRKIPITALNK